MSASQIVTQAGTIAVNGGVVKLLTQGLPVTGLEITGTWVGTLQVEVLTDGATTANATIVDRLGAAVSLPLTANQHAFVNTSGSVVIQVRASAWVSGTATIGLAAGLGVVPQAAGGSAVSISDGSFVTFGAEADASAAADNSTTTFMSLFKRLLARLTTLLPQASSRLVVDASQVAVPITDNAGSLTVDGTVAVTNANLDAATSTLATQATLALIKAKTDNLDAATSTLLTISDFDTKAGALTETAPATDIASSGLNGRLQRIAQRLTSLIALFPTALGTTTAANSLPVTLSTDGQFVTSTGSLTETAPATDTASSGLNGRLQRVAQRLTSLIALLPSALISNRLDVNLGAAPALVTVQGDAAAGAAVAGNPVLMGLSDGISAQTWKQTPLSQGAITPTGVPLVGIGLLNGTADLRALECGLGANGNSALQNINVAPQSYNGGNYDSLRSNVDVTLLASAARTTLQNSANITTYNCKGIIVTVDVTANVSTISLTPSINYIDPASGKTIPLLTATTIAALGTFTYWVDEAALASVPAPFTKTAQAALGRIITINMAVGNANSQTYSVGYTLIP